MTLAQEFKAFMAKGNVVDLAVGVVIGGAFGKIVTAFVDDLVMPVVGAVLPGGDWRAFTVTPLNIKVGHLIGSVIDFVIIAGVVFLTLVKLVGMMRRREEAAAPPAPATKPCAECLEAIPALAKRCRACGSAVAAAIAGLVLLAFGAGSAYAADPPKFEFAKPEEVKTVEWKAQGKGGMVLTSGNSRTTAATFGFTASRKEAGNKLSLEGSWAYAKSRFLDATDSNGNMMVDAGEVTNTTRTATDAWNGKARYDRFLTANNVAYASVQFAADKPGGKELVGGGQIGYSRQVVKTDHHLVLAELGYDFSHEKYVQTPDSVDIHSARVFAGETITVTKETGLFVNAEVLMNLNAEKAPGAGYDAPAAFDDTRVVAKAGLTTTLWKNLSFGFSFTGRYDHAPAPRSNTYKWPYAADYHPVVNNLDTLTEATLIVTFL